MTVRFDLPDSAPLRPFAIVGPTGMAFFDDPDLRLVDALDASEAPFCEAMNRGNCLAYDGTVAPGAASTALGMPRWVMLDCCILPSAVFGFETPRRFVPEALASQLDPGGTLEWLGVSEYIAMPSVRPGEVVGASLFSFVGNRRLGTRTKAMSLRLLGASRQLGITQWSGAGVKLHLGFGPMKLTSTRVAIHNRPDETFVYEVAVPSRPDLERLEAGERVTFDTPMRRTLACDPRVDDVRHLVESQLERGGSAWIIDAGPVVDGRVSRLEFGFDV